MCPRKLPRKPNSLQNGIRVCHVSVMANRISWIFEESWQPSTCALVRLEFFSFTFLVSYRFIVFNSFWFVYYTLESCSGITLHCSVQCVKETGVYFNVHYLDLCMSQWKWDKWCDDDKLRFVQNVMWMKWTLKICDVINGKYFVSNCTKLTVSIAQSTEIKSREIN